MLIIKDQSIFFYTNHIREKIDPNIILNIFNHNEGRLKCIKISNFNFI